MIARSHFECCSARVGAKRSVSRSLYKIIIV
jgi:hypothetical protein